MKFKRALFYFIIPLILLSIVPCLVTKYWDWLSVNSDVLRNIVLILSPILALFIAFWRICIADKQTGISGKNNLDSFFQKGVEMIGAESTRFCIGGIYSLALLSKEHPEQYHLISMKIICSFLNYLGFMNWKGELSSEYSGYNYPLLMQELISFLRSRGETQYLIEEKDGYTIDLKKVDLSKLNFKNVNLKGASLISVQFNHSDLRGSNLCKINADLEDFDLLDHNNNLNRKHSTSFENTRLNDTNLQGSSLRGTVLDGADFSNAILEGAKITSASIKEVNFSGSNLKRADLDNVIGKIDGSIMQGIGEEWYPDFLPYVGPRRASFKKAVLIDASLKNANLMGANFRNANLESANISNANLMGAIFSGSNLKKIEGIGSAKLTDAIYDKRTKFPEVFCPETRGMKEECPNSDEVPCKFICIRNKLADKR